MPPLALANGLGGFADAGREYVVVLEGAEETPSPWVNVIANPGFGTIVTASGSAFTWSRNSRENRLTPFANDPVTDPTAEAIFIRDDDTGDVLVAHARAAASDRGRRPPRDPPRGRASPASLTRSERHPAASWRCSSTTPTR